MMQRVLRALGRIKGNLSERGLRGTVRWLWNCAVYQYSQLGPTPWPDYKQYKRDKTEQKHLHLKESRRVFLFAGTPYYDIGGGQRSAQLAKTFNRLGYEVYYYYCHKSADFIPENRMDIPCVSHMQLKALKLSDFRKLVREDDLMLTEYQGPEIAPYTACAKERGAKLGYETAGRPRNGVDDELFAAGLHFERPADMVLGSKTYLYYGRLCSEQIDWELLFGFAERQPHAAVNLIGSYPPRDIMERAPKNVHFLGVKKHTQLPVYLKYADFALLPCKTEGAPIKLYEYIAMGKNVLTTPLPDAQDCPNVYTGSTSDEWIKALETAGEPDLAAADAFAAANTWDSRVEQLLRRLYPAEAPRCDEAFYGRVSIVILNYNNKNIIDKSLATLLRCRDRYGYEIVVVDNQSRDGSYEQLQERFGDQITLVRNSKNGCSSGRNFGVKHATRDYVLFLDSDQWATGDYWLDPYFEIVRRAPNFGAVGWAGGWFDKEGKAAHIAANEPFQYMPPVGLFRGDIGYLGTGGMFLERSLFDAIGGFDEFYDPTCYEDTDLSLQIRHAGRELYYSRSLGVVHLPHQTTKDGSANHTRLMEEKQRYFTNKWRTLDPKLLDYIKVK